MSGGSWQCEACGKGFRSLSAFDMHRTGEYGSGRRKLSTRRCMTTAEMRDKRMIVQANGAWSGPARNTHFTAA